MTYLGGKDRLAHLIAKCILAYTAKRDSYLECFFGGGNSYRYLASEFNESKVGDIHADVIAMWQAVKDGWLPPEYVNEAEYYRVKKLPSPDPLRGFVGFSCSFGGKWWGGYARDFGRNNENATNRNFAEAQCRNVDSIGSLLRLNDTMILPVDYSSWSPSSYTVVYADPPYANTTHYKNHFNSKRFWEVMDQWAERGVSVFVSEYAAPDHWKVIGEFSHSCSLHTVKHEATERVERVFTR